MQEEVDSLREQLDNDRTVQNTIDLEGKLKYNQRMIVELMTENIYNLRFDLPVNEKQQAKMDRDALLASMLISRTKRMKTIEKLLKVAQ